MNKIYSYKKIIEYFFILLCLNIKSNESYRFLGIFPHPAVSHFRAFEPLLTELSLQGHEVFVISHFPNKSAVKNYHDFSLDQNDIMTESVSVDEVYSPRNWTTYKIEFDSLIEWGHDACDKLLASKHIDKLMEINQNHKFDVLITEFFNTDCSLGIAYKMNITKFIGMSSCALMPWHYSRVGLPDFPSYIPSEFVGFTTNMNFIERFTNWAVVTFTKIGYKFAQMKDTDKLRRRFKDENIPSLSELADQTSLIFVNQHYSLSIPKPLPANVVEIGGIHIKNTRKSLPLDLQNILDNASDGVIYVSWGSIINSKGMPIEKRKEIVNAFKKLPQTILWKWENDSLTATAKNIHIRSWMPQIDILCHPNVKAFFSHGGMMGISEGVYCGKPVVITPIYGDQFLNGASLVHREMGIILHYDELIEDKIISVAKNILQPSYKDRAEEVSKCYRNRLSDPLSTAIYWTEYVAENENQLIRSETAINLNYFSYSSLDFICVFAILLFVLIFSIKYLTNKSSVTPNVFVKSNKKEH